MIGLFCYLYAVPEGLKQQILANGWDFFVLNSLLIGKVYFKIVADGLCLIYTGIKILKNKLFI
jgi:hypothetical protein